VPNREGEAISRASILFLPRKPQDEQPEKQRNDPDSTADDSFMLTLQKG
jgi:hypothetical protein